MVILWGLFSCMRDSISDVRISHAIFSLICIYFIATFMKAIFFSMNCKYRRIHAGYFKDFLEMLERYRVLFTFILVSYIISFLFFYWTKDVLEFVWDQVAITILLLSCILLLFFVYGKHLHIKEKIRKGFVYIFGFLKIFRRKWNERRK